MAVLADWLCTCLWYRLRWVRFPYVAPSLKFKQNKRKYVKMPRKIQNLMYQGERIIDNDINHNSSEYKRRAFLASFLRRYLNNSNVFVTGVPLGDFHDTISFIKCVSTEFNLLSSSNSGGIYRSKSDGKVKKRTSNHVLSDNPSIIYDTQSQAKIGVQVVNANYSFRRNLLPIEFHFHIEDPGEAIGLIKKGDILKYTIYYCLDLSKEAVRSEKKITYNPRAMKKME